MRTIVVALYVIIDVEFQRLGLITNEAQPAKQYRPRLRTPSLACEGAGEG